MVIVVKNLLAKTRDVRDAGSVPGLGRSLGGGHCNQLQNSCLENSMDREAWRAMVQRVIKSWTRLKQLNTHSHKKMGSRELLVEQLHSII